MSSDGDDDDGGHVVVSGGWGGQPGFGAVSTLDFDGVAVEVHYEGLIAVCFVCSLEEGCLRGIREVRHQDSNPCLLTLEVLLPQTPHFLACLGLEDLELQLDLQDQGHLSHLLLM